nr:flagellar protein FlaG [uncultured Desulfobulbus sp.]
MNIEAVGSNIASPPRTSEASQQVENKRQASQETTPSSSEEESQVQSEELLDQIKALTEDGLYSVRFEQESGIDDLVVKVVDRETDEVIRQIPPEELLKLTQKLKALAGNLIDTMS